MTPKRPWKGGWSLYREGAHACWVHARLSLMAISDVVPDADGKLWYHVSVSTIAATPTAPRRLANDAECEAVRRAFGIRGAHESNKHVSADGVGRHFWFPCGEPS
jgi:hypothetical protein